MELWLANFLRKGTNLIFKEQYVNNKIGSGIFPKILPFFVSVILSGLVRISQNEVLLERSIFADVVAYQFITMN